MLPENTRIGLFTYLEIGTISLVPFEIVLSKFLVYLSALKIQSYKFIFETVYICFENHREYVGVESAVSLAKSRPFYLMLFNLSEQ